LFEEFFTDQDVLDNHTYDSLGVIKNARKLSKKQINETLSGLKTMMNSGSYDKNDIVGLLKDFIPGFAHIETGKSLDQKM
jgi:hypothetical protein